MTSLAVSTFERVARQQGGRFEYVRGELVVELTGLCSLKRYFMRDSNGVLMQYSSHDICVRADQLLLAGTPVEPRRGDVLRRVVSGRRQTFEVQCPDLSEPVYRWSDAGGEIYRIHTGLISHEGVA